MNPIACWKSLIGRRLPAEFWQALLLVHDEWNQRQFSNLHFAPWEVRGDEFQNALRTLDCWLDVAISEGWLE